MIAFWIFTESRKPAMSQEGVAPKSDADLERLNEIYVLGDRAITISPEMRDARNTPAIKISKDAIRFPPNKCAKIVWAGRGYTITEAEQRLGWSFWLDKVRDKRIPPQVMILRRLPKQQLPEWVVRYSPKTLASKCSHKIYRERLTKMEMMLGRQVNAEVERDYYKNNYEEVVAKKNAPKERQRLRDYGSQYAREKRQGYREVVGEADPININPKNNPHPPDFANIPSKYTNELYRWMTEKYMVKIGESCEFCKCKFQKSGINTVTLSHNIPKSRRRDFSLSLTNFHSSENLIVMCRRCAHKKKSKTMAEWLGSGASYFF